MELKFVIIFVAITICISRVQSYAFAEHGNLGSVFKYAVSSEEKQLPPMAEGDEGSEESTEASVEKTKESAELAELAGLNVHEHGDDDINPEEFPYTADRAQSIHAVNDPSEETEEINDSSNETADGKDSSEEAEETNDSSNETQETNDSSNETAENKNSSEENALINGSSEETAETNDASNETEETNDFSNENAESKDSSDETTETNDSSNETAETNDSSNETAETNDSSNETAEMKDSSEETWDSYKDTTETNDSSEENVEAAKTKEERHRHDEELSLPPSANDEFSQEYNENTLNKFDTDDEGSNTIQLENDGNGQPSLIVLSPKVEGPIHSLGIHTLSKSAHKEAMIMVNQPMPTLKNSLINGISNIEGGDSFENALTNNNAVQFSIPQFILQNRFVNIPRIIN